MSQHNYNIYPSLLDKFDGYINSSRIYQEYYGFSEEPAVSEAEFEQQKYQDLLNGINRVPFESEAADKGTMFNEVIDCIIENRKSDKMEITVNHAAPAIQVKWKNWMKAFNLNDCRLIARELKDSICQDYKEAFIDTKYGRVKLYGYSDYIQRFKVVDLKTTGKYYAFKFRNNWQHIVYPFLLHANGISISEFEYLIYRWNANGGDLFRENYTYDPERDLPKLTDFVEQFIEFLETNRDKITDLKIFNQLTEKV